MQDVKPMLAEATLRVAKMDAIDHENGWAAPGDVSSPLTVDLATGVMAVIAGMTTEDWNTVAEGVVLLQRLEIRMGGAATQP